MVRHLTWFTTVGTEYLARTRCTLLAHRRRILITANRAAYWGTSAIAVGWRVIADGAHRDVGERSPRQAATSARYNCWPISRAVSACHQAVDGHGSIRRECVDHFIVLGEAHLRRILRAYVHYYNEVRTHRSFVLNPWRTSPPLCASLGFRYTQGWLRQLVTSKRASYAHWL
jgi:hypothetical protein